MLAPATYRLPSPARVDPSQRSSDEHENDESDLNGRPTLEGQDHCKQQAEASQDHGDNQVEPSHLLTIVRATRRLESTHRERPKRALRPEDQQ